MSSRKHNFNPGPAALPLSVLEQAARDLVDYRGLGLGIPEMSHRSAEFAEIIDRARASLTRLYAVPDSHEVLFLQGGASLQFAMIPMNFGVGGAYINTGVWSAKALKEARVLGLAYDVWSDEAGGYRRVPGPEVSFGLPDGCRYLHYTSNNTIFGTQYRHVPKTTVPRICDMSSDFLSQPIDVSAFDLIYAGAQKNAGPAGVTIVIGRRDRLRGFDGLPGTPKILRYATHAEKGSLFHTPNTFGIYLAGLVVDWVEAQGGLKGIARLNARKAERLYNVVDGRPDTFSGHAEPASRSHMNVTFTLVDPTREADLLAAATERGIMGIKGHRSVGGLRASIYNAVSMESVDVLATLLERW